MFPLVIFALHFWVSFRHFFSVILPPPPLPPTITLETYLIAFYALKLNFVTFPAIMFNRNNQLKCEAEPKSSDATPAGIPIVNNLPSLTEEATAQLGWRPWRGQLCCSTWEDRKEWWREGGTNREGEEELWSLNFAESLQQLAETRTSSPLWTTLGFWWRMNHDTVRPGNEIRTWGNTLDESSTAAGGNLDENVFHPKGHWQCRGFCHRNLLWATDAVWCAVVHQP